MDKYIYSPLSDPSHTRLIKLRPALINTAVLQYTLVEVPIDDPPPYIAISYAWMGQKLDQHSECEKKSLLITENARDALRRLQYRLHSRYLWLDAICIDQSSIVDKTH